MHTNAFEQERPHLLSVAFRILGSESDAQDVVQETWIRYDRTDTSTIRNVRTWLTTVVTRLCLDSLRRRREIPQEPDELPAVSDDDPEETAFLANDLTAAFVVVLYELTPPQRVALVLHDAFGVSFEEIAHILGTTVGSAKKLASRARGRVRHGHAASAEDVEKARDVVDAFLHAVREGNTDRLIALLDPNVVRMADPQAFPPRGAQRIQGVHAVAAETRAFQANASHARVASIDGWPGIVVLDGSAVRLALAVRVEGDRIVHFEAIADPQRLALLHIQ